MRRAPIVLTATVLGTTGVLLFKPLTATQAAALDGTATSSSADSRSGERSTSDATASATSAASPSPTSTPSDDAEKDLSGAYAGSAVTTRFGTTQVKVTLRDGAITGIETLSLNENDPRSEQISESAIPILRQEVLAKQTAAVDTVSGATYTSLAYEASLQAALDKAGYHAADGSKASTATPNEGFGH